MAENPLQINELTGKSCSTYHLKISSFHPDQLPNVINTSKIAYRIKTTEVRKKFMDARIEQKIFHITRPSSKLAWLYFIRSLAALFTFPVVFARCIANTSHYSTNSKRKAWELHGGCFLNGRYF